MDPSTRRNLYCNVADGGRLTSLFAIRGDPGAISTELDELSEVVRYDITTDVDDMCYVNVQIEMEGLVRTFFDIISREYITLVLPVVYTNGRATVELVGSDGSLQEAVDSLPATVHVDIEGIGEFTDGTLLWRRLLVASCLAISKVQLSRPSLPERT
jgi:hypothetical protein